MCMLHIRAVQGSDNHHFVALLPASLLPVVRVKDHCMKRVQINPALLRWAVERASGKEAPPKAFSQIA